MQFITLTDYLLLPLYVGLIYLIAYNVRRRKYPEGHPWRPYFLPALTVKIIGAIFIGMVYQYYYGGGDTSEYFRQSQAVNDMLHESFAMWVKTLFHIPGWFDEGYYYYLSQVDWYGSPNTYTVISIASFLSALTFNTYLPASVLFAALSFTGVWAMFKTFAGQYPKLVRHVAIAILFVPSTFIWGSGIFKDTICMFALGWFTYGVFRLLIQREFSLSNIVATILSFCLLYVVKLYILVAFLPALILWIMFTYSHKIKIWLFRFLMKLAVFGIAGIGFMVFSTKFSEEMGQYSLDNVAKTSTVTRDWIVYSSGESGSVYDLGDFEPTMAGMLKMFPKAVNVTLFRPYLWEAKKVFVLSNAIEAFILLLLTIKIIFVIGPIRVWAAISSDPNIQFCLIFTLIFAFAVGLSSYNFGALSRYRIPCMPTYVLSLMLIYYKYTDPDRRFLSFK